MSQTDGVAPDGGGEVQPLVVYNCVHHREQNAIDCTADPALAVAAQTYNAAIVAGFPKLQPQMNKYHPLNFGGAGSPNSITTLPSKLDVLAALALANAEAQRVLTSNFERLVKENLAASASTQAEQVIAALRDFDAMLRPNATHSPWLGEAAPRSSFDQLQSEMAAMSGL